MKDDRDVRIQIGQAIRRRREALRLSQEELAHRAGVHRTYLGSIERGERNPAIENLSKIATALGVTVAELAGDAGL